MDKRIVGRIVRTLAASIMIAVLVALTTGGVGVAAGLKAPARYKNCTALNKLYPHGVGKLKARDRSASGEPVTNFKRSTRVYLEAMSHNKGLDRDKDGVACESD
jgi:hypothetical protein